MIEFLLGVNFELGGDDVHVLGAAEHLHFGQSNFLRSFSGIGLGLCIDDQRRPSSHFWAIR
jgi:hypothetical protein